MSIRSTLVVFVCILCSVSVPLQAQEIVRLILDEAGLIREHQFGAAVALSDNHLLVGSLGDFNERWYSGTVYIYENQDDQWLPKDTITTTGYSGLFGAALAADEEYALVAGDLRLEDGGAVYVYKRVADEWHFQEKIASPDTSTFTGFGRNLALQGNRAFIAASAKAYEERGGIVYVYERQDEDWTLQTALTPSRPVGADAFGRPFCLAENTLAVSASFDSEQGEYAGAVYVFEREGDAWTERAKLMPAQGTRHDFFGQTLACSADELIITQSDGDFAHRFTRVGETWIEEQDRIVLPDSDPLDGHTNALLYEDHLLITMYERSRVYAGAVYMFSKENGRWTFIEKLSVPNPSISDGFGDALVMNEAWIIAGTPYEDVYVEEEGAVYLLPRDAESLVWPVGVEEDALLEGTPRIHTYPNPFRAATTIQYSLSQPGHVQIRVYDVLGRTVATLVDTRQTRGVYEVAFAAQGLPAGVYFARLQVGPLRLTRALLLHR